MANALAYYGTELITVHDTGTRLSVCITEPLSKKASCYVYWMKKKYFALLKLPSLEQNLSKYRPKSLYNLPETYPCDIYGC